jgi:hypothetical protein
MYDGKRYNNSVLELFQISPSIALPTSVLVSLLVSLSFSHITLLHISSSVMTVVSSFAVGLLFSATSTYYISNTLRDRKLLCREKYDDENVKAYFYELVRNSIIQEIPVCFGNIHNNLATQRASLKRENWLSESIL